MQKKSRFEASITVKVDAKIKQRLQEIKNEFGGSLTISDLVRMFIEDGLYERGLLPKGYKHSRGL